MVNIRFTVYLSPTMSVAFAIVEGIFRAQPSVPVVGVSVGAAAAISMGGVVVVAAFRRLTLATGMGGVNTVGPAILVEVAPSALGFWALCRCVFLPFESIEFLKDCGQNRVAGAGAGGIRCASMGAGECAFIGCRGGDAALDGSEIVFHGGIHVVLHLGNFLSDSREVVAGQSSGLIGCIRGDIYAGVKVTEFGVEVLLEGFVSGMVVGREVSVLA